MTTPTDRVRKAFDTAKRRTRDFEILLHAYADRTEASGHAWKLAEEDHPGESFSSYDFETKTLITKEQEASMTSYARG